MWMLAALAILVPFVVAWGGTYLVRKWARKRDFVDRPGGHKQHGDAIALGGGVAIIWAICLPILAGMGVALLLPTDPAPSWIPAPVAPHLEGIVSCWPTVLIILACAAGLHIIGLIDDLVPLGPAPKFAAQFAAAFIVVGFGGIRVMEAFPPVLSILLTVLWIVLITNAFNFLDNMDGLSAGVAAIATFVFALAAVRAGQVFVPTLAWVIAGALLGFLWFNYHPASIFMGDAGSLVVGFLMSVLTILTTYYDPEQQMSPTGVLVPLMVLAVPLYDVASVVTHRVRLGISPLKGDRRHFSHRLVRRGMSVRGAVLTIYLATAATALPAVVLPMTTWLDAILLILQCLCVVAIIAILEHAGTEPLDA
jgi:UDP-GlcNAc:undecaprenyl-phosphate GlcNAc-1-phosphate transferase